MEAESVQALVVAAQQAWPQAYAPYSRFRVGCCLEAGDGSLVTGANIENTALPAGLCAEAAALGGLISAGHRQVRAAAIVAEAGFCPPCGTCRQRLAEFAVSGMIVYLPDARGAVASYPLADLLPLGFSQAAVAGQERSP